MDEKTSRGILYYTSEIPNELAFKNEGYIFIKRVKVTNGVKKEYYTFPGGHVDNNDSFEETILREIEEELNIKVEIIKLIADIYNSEISRKEKFYELKYIDGILKEGNGEEFTNKDPDKYGTFEIVVIPKDKINQYNILPKEVKIILENN